MHDSAEIVREVHAALGRDQRIDLSRHPIVIQCEPDGSLVLQGETKSLAAKKIALELAASVGGLTGVVDRIRVAPRQPMGDAAIRDHIRAAMLQEGAFTRCEIQAAEEGRARSAAETAGDRGSYIAIAVADGVVTLDGQVESLSHKRLVELLAWWVPGTRDVVNGIEVKPYEEDSDDEITDAVTMALEKDRLVTHDSIRVSVRDSVVTLEGVVPNRRQAEMAEADAWYIFSVDGVINHLRAAQD
jgi:osmotically-inducible protein OsmY